MEKRQTWKPGGAVAIHGCRFVYIPSEDDHSDLKKCVEDALPESFKPVGVLREDAVVVAQNGLFEVYIASCNWASVIAVQLREDAPEFAKYRLSYESNAIFKKIAEHYKVMVSNGRRFAKWKGKGA